MTEEKDRKKKELGIVSFKKDSDYYLEKGNQYLQRNIYEKALKYFRKAVEVNPENISLHYKIAYNLTELGKVQKKAEIKKLADEPLPEFLFLTGVYCCMEGDLDNTISYLEEFKTTAPESKLIPKTNKLLEEIEEAMLFQRNLNYVKLNYKYAGVTESVREKLKAKFESPFVRVKMKESLYQLDDDLIANVIFLYGLLENNEKAERVLKQFIKSPWAKEEHIELALLALKKIGSKEPHEILMEGKIVKVTLKDYMDRNRTMDQQGDKWNDVLKHTLSNMKKSGKYNENSYNEIKSLWTKVLKSYYPNVPEIDDKMAWAAGLEFAFLENNNINISSKHIALIYNVPNSILIDKYELIRKTIK